MKNWKSSILPKQSDFVQVEIEIDTYKPYAIAPVIKLYEKRFENTNVSVFLRLMINNTIATRLKKRYLYMKKAI